MSKDKDTCIFSRQVDSIVRISPNRSYSDRRKFTRTLPFLTRGYATAYKQVVVGNLGYAN